MRSGTISFAPARPLPAPPSGREAVLDALLDPSRLPTQPAVALRVVDAASRPNCRPGEIVALLSQDPVLCAKLLKAVNSSGYGLTRPVGSIDRAVLVVGLNKVRALALGLSLPAMRPQARVDSDAREHALASVGGAIVARELAIRLKYPAPEDDLVAGLLRDIGVILLRQTFPDAWAALAAGPADPLEEARCDREREAFQVDHAEVGAEVLKGWNLPADIVEPIRHHHRPEALAGVDKVQADRAELLWFAGLLIRLEHLVAHPAHLDRVMDIAATRFGLPLSELAEFMQKVWPKVDEYAKLLSRDVGPCPNFTAIVSAGMSALVKLTPG